MWPMFATIHGTVMPHILNEVWAWAARNKWMGGGSRHLHRCSERMSQSCRQTDRASPLAGRQHHQTSLHLRPFPLLPLERSLLGAAAAAAPPVTAAQAPFSCSSPLLFVRLLFFPLLLFWLGILQDSSVKSYFRPLSTAPVSAVWHFCGLHFSSGPLQCFVFNAGFSLCGDAFGPLLARRVEFSAAGLRNKLV